MSEIKRISTILANGTKVDYNVILTNKKIRFYAAIYNPELPTPFMGEPATKEEWNEIVSAIDNVILPK